MTETQQQIQPSRPTANQTFAPSASKENKKLISNQISFENINDDNKTAVNSSKPDGITLGATNVESNDQSLRNLNETDFTVAPELNRRVNLSRESHNQTLGSFSGTADGNQMRNDMMASAP